MCIYILCIYIYYIILHTLPYITCTNTVLKSLSHQAGESHNVPISQRRYRKITSGSGKLHQGRRNTIAQPVSPVIGDLAKSSRSIAHSDDFEGHKSIQTHSWQQILLAWKCSVCPAAHDQIKPLLVHPDFFCNATGLVVANPIGRARYRDIGI